MALYHEIENAIREASRSMESLSLSGETVVPLSAYRKLQAEAADEDDDRDLNCFPNPYDKVLEVLVHGVKEINALKGHSHVWDENDYCSICGADGRA